METLTTTEAAVAGGMLASVIITSAIVWLLLIIANWKIFKKAGEAGWKSLIPIYNIYILFKISGVRAWFWYDIVVTIICAIVAGCAGGIEYDANLQMVGNPSMVAILALIFSVVFNCIVTIYLYYRLAKAFKKGIGYMLGLIFFPNIFTLILGFGSAKYDKKVLKA